MTITSERILIDPTGAANDAVLAALEFFSSGSIVLITTLIAILYYAGKLLTREHTKASVVAPIIAAVTLLASFSYCYVSRGDALLGTTFVALIRSVLASALSFVASYLVCRVVTPISSFLYSIYCKAREQIQRLSMDFQTWREHRRTLWEMRNQPEPEPIPPRSRRIRKCVKEAQKEFAVEAKLIEETADLEDIERHALMLAAKQRYVQKMNRMLQ